MTQHDITKGERKRGARVVVFECFYPSEYERLVSLFRLFCKMHDSWSLVGLDALPVYMIWCRRRWMVVERFKLCGPTMKDEIQNWFDSEKLPQTALSLRRSCKHYRSFLSITSSSPAAATTDCILKLLFLNSSHACSRDVSAHLSWHSSSTP